MSKQPVMTFVRSIKLTCWFTFSCLSWIL